MGSSRKYRVRRVRSAPRPQTPPQYTRYRARLQAARDRRATAIGRPACSPAATRGLRLRTGARRRSCRPRAPSARARPGATRWRRWITPKRVLLGLLALILAWLALSLVLFLISSHFERTSLPANVAERARPGRAIPLTSANNILVLGSDRRQKNSKEPGAETTGFGRSDTIMLIRTGGGHAARLSIPRDTVIEIPGHGLQKINAAHEFGGPAESISVIKHWLGIPINHVVEVNFENFPAADRRDGRRHLHRRLHRLEPRRRLQPRAASRCA